MEDVCIWESESGIQAVQLAVVQQLEALGLPVPRGEPDSQPSKNEGVYKCAFGTSLFSQPTFSYQWKGRIFNLPRIFVVLVKFLEDHVCDEGLFRKAGSVSRQRVLRRLLESPHPSLPCDCNVHDVASLFKQFLRELPRPLVPGHYWPLLEACVSMLPAKDQPRALQLAALLLPSICLQCLCVVMDLLGRISSGVAAGQSLMDADSLAVVMAPNLVETSRNIVNVHDHILKAQRRIVKLLIEGAEELGLVPREVEVAAANVRLQYGVMETRSLDDMLQSSDDPLPSHPGSRKPTISGLLSGWSNKLLRRKGGVVSEQLPSCRKRAMKRSQQDPLERPGKRQALDQGSGWWTLRKRGVAGGVAKSNECLHRLPLGLSGTAQMTSEDDAASRGVASTNHTPDSSHLSSDNTPGSSPNLSFSDLTSDPSRHSDYTPSSDDAPDSSHPVPPTPLLGSRLRSAKLRHSKGLTASAASNEATPSPVRGELQEDFHLSSPAPLISTPISADVNRKSYDHIEVTPANGVVSCDLEATPTANRLFGGVLGNLPTATHSPNLMTKICTEMARRSYHRHVLDEAGEERVNAEGHVIQKKVGVRSAIESGGRQERVGVDGDVTEGNLRGGDKLEGVDDNDITGSDAMATGGCLLNGGTAKRCRPAAADYSFSISTQGLMRFGSCSRYSATLGIDLVDLPRRKLRKCEEPMERDGLTEEPHPLLDGRRHRPSSPVVHSASLGITQLRGARRRGKRAGPRETRLRNASGDATGTPPPPILKILEMNRVSRRNRGSAAAKAGSRVAEGNNEVPPATADSALTGVGKNAQPLEDTNSVKAGGTVSSPNTAGGQVPRGNIGPLNPPTTNETALPPISDAPFKPLGQKSEKPLSSLNLPPVVEETGPKPPHQQRYKSPWRWSSMRNRHDYTPVKSKGIVSKRAQPYMVKLPRASSCYAGFLSDGAAAHQENLPPLPRKVKGQGDINVEEWVL